MTIKELHPNIQLAEKLMKIYIDGQTFNNTARYIIDRLSVLDEKSAMNEYMNDGDKIPSYNKWGKKFKQILNQELGCRTHGIKNCHKTWCVEIN